MYELRELQGYEFSTTEESKTAADDQVEIVNHLFIRNMSLVRNLNPCLSLYKVVCTNQASNEYSYILKTNESEDAEDSSKADKSIERLESMLALKPLY